MRAGRQDREVTFMRKSLTISPAGSPVETWAPVRVGGSALIWASMRPVKGDEKISSERLAATEQTEFRLHWCTELETLSPLDQLLEPGLADGSPEEDYASVPDRRKYEIIEVQEIGRREGILIIGSRLVDTVVLS